MRIAVVSDTHMPRGARRVPEVCVVAMREADAILHAGDLMAEEFWEWLRGLGPPVHVVHGNVDSPGLRRELPETLEVELGGARFAMVHDAGPSKGRLARMRARFPAADAVVFGHSHLPLSESEGGFQIFNPGSPTERRRAPRASFGIAEAREGEIRFEHRWIEPA